MENENDAMEAADNNAAPSFEEALAAMTAEEEQPIEDPVEDEAEDQVEDDDAPEDEEDEGEDEDDDTPRFTVTVDGEEYEVTEEELVNGYQRQADYTRKAQALADERRQVEGQRINIMEQSEAYAQSYLQVAEMFAQTAPSEDDIKKAWAYDPGEAAALRDKRDTVLQQAGQVHDLAKNMMSGQHQALQAAMQECSNALPQHVPEWQDAEVRKSELTEITQYLIGAGVTQAELMRGVNPASWAIARKAWMFDRLQSKEDQGGRKAKAPNIRKKRAPKPRLAGSRKRAAQAKNRFDQNPTRDNAMALLMAAEEGKS